MNIITYLKLVDTGLNIKNIAKHVFPKHNKTQIIDHYSCIFRLVINSFKPIGTKICVCENRIILQDPSYIQGSLRTINGDNKEDLHFLLEPIRNACFRIKKNLMTTYLFEKAKIGLINLKQTYQTYPIISRCIELYINYIEAYLENKLDEIDKGDFEHSILEKEIYSKIYDGLNKIWNDNRIDIIYNMLMEIEILNKKNKIKEIENLIDILDKFILFVEKDSKNSIFNFN